MGLFSKYRYRLIHSSSISVTFLVGLVILIRLSKTGHVDSVVQSCGFALILMSIIAIIPVFIVNEYPIIVK